MDISERKQQILKAVIDDYIETAEPVGSKSIAGRSGLKLSSATIRNEMAELEEMGYLEQPHTSAGRIPSPKGYRLYVDQLMRRQSLSLEETERINSAMRQKLNELDRLLTSAARLISQITGYPTYSLSPASGGDSIQRFELIHIDSSSFICVLMTDSKTVRNKLFRLPHSGDEQHFHQLSAMLNKVFAGLEQHEYTSELISGAVEASGPLGSVVSLVLGYAIELMEETSQRQVAVSGASHLLQQPEYRDVEKAHRMLSYLSEEQKLARIPAPEGDGSMKILIGPENVAEELRDASVVVASYDIGDNMQGLVGVVGPTRMDYAKVSARLQYFSSSIGRMMQQDDPIKKLKDEKT